jgi:hypothetical protein
LKAIKRGIVNILCNNALASQNELHEKEKIPLSKEFYLKAIEKDEINTLCNYAFALQN